MGLLEKYILFYGGLLTELPYFLNKRSKIEFAEAKDTISYGKTVRFFYAAAVIVTKCIKDIPKL